MRWGKFFFLFFVFFLSCGRSTRVGYNLKAPVHVIIDRCGVPHIFAENEGDAFYVFGYIQAHMRLFQMDISRREATGRTAEIFPSALSSDIMTRMLGFKKITEISRESFANTGMIKKISAFVEGINRYISDAKSGREFGGIRAEIPKQYQILGVEPQSFSVEDIIAMGKARSFDLSGGGLIDIAMKLIQLIYGDNFESNFSISQVEKISIVNDLGKTRITFLSEIGRNLKGGNRNRIDGERGGKIGEKDIEVLISAISGKNIKNVLPNFALPYIFSGRGSNNFVVSGKITKHGYPILENDPHLATDSPSTFFPFQIKTPEYEVKGFTFPGIPIALVGATPKLCWGVTTTLIDVADILIVPIKKSGENYYVEVGGKDIKAEEVEEEIIYREYQDGTLKSIKIKFLYVPNLGFVVEPGKYEEFTSIIPFLLGAGGIGGEIEKVIREIIKGTILFGVDGIEKEKIPEYGIVLAWTGYKPTSEFASFYEFTNSKDVFSAMQMIKFFQAGAQNFILADTKGNIAYFPHGEFPIRKQGVKPYLPNVSSELFWVGVIPPDLIPRAINPTSGYIVTANNDIIGTTFDNNPMNERYYLGPAFDIGFRAKEISESIEKSKGYFDEITAGIIVNDTTSLLAKRFLEIYFKLVDESDIENFSASATQKEVMLHIHRKLKDWKFIEDVNSQETLYFEMLFQMSIARIMWDNFIKKYFVKRTEEILKNIEVSEDVKNILIPLLPVIIPQIAGTIFDLIKDPNVSFRTVYPIISGEKGEICPEEKIEVGESDLRYIFLGEDLCPKDEFLKSLSDTAEYLKEYEVICGGDYSKCVLGDFAGKRFSYIKSFPGSEKFEPKYKMPDGRKTFYFRKTGGTLLVYAADINMISLKTPTTIEELMNTSPEFRPPPYGKENNPDNVPFTIGGGQTIKFICSAKPEGTYVRYVIPGGVADDPDSPYFANQITAWSCAKEWLMGTTQGYCSIPNEILSSVKAKGEKINAPSEETFKLVFSELEDDFGKLISGEYHTSPVCQGKEIYLIFK